MLTLGARFRCEIPQNARIAEPTVSVSALSGAGEVWCPRARTACSIDPHGCPRSLPTVRQLGPVAADRIAR